MNIQAVAHRLSHYKLKKVGVMSFLAAILILCFVMAATAQTPGAGTRRNFTLFGDLKIDASAAGADAPNGMFDVILYTRGGDVFARQRIANGQRYRFNNIFNGDYYLALEYENKEIVRMPLLISGNFADDIRQDLNLQWRATPGSAASGAVSAEDLYNRSAHNKTLYEKAASEINSKNFPQAITTLKELVAADAKDFPAWTDLGMVYFIQKDYEAAENCFTSALGVKPDHFQALLNLGRVQIARKNYEKAVETLETALKVNPKSAQTNYFLGETYLQLKKGSKAVSYLNDAITLDPVGMADAHLRLATLYNAAGYKDRAANEYEEFLKVKADYPERKKLEEYIQANKPRTDAPKP
jgi:tetratricopeptide (TPR) repeat protein